MQIHVSKVLVSKVYPALLVLQVIIMKYDSKFSHLYQIFAFWLRYYLGEHFRMKTVSSLWYTYHYFARPPPKYSWPEHRLLNITGNSK